MTEIPNVVGHVVGPLSWLAFLALVLWYGVWGAMIERREVAEARARRRPRVHLRRIHRAGRRHS